MWYNLGQTTFKSTFDQRMARLTMTFYLGWLVSAVNLGFG
jgi:hypothetical protein